MDRNTQLKGKEVLEYLKKRFHYQDRIKEFEGNLNKVIIGNETFILDDFSLEIVKKLCVKLARLKLMEDSIEDYYMFHFQ